jgi:hypothetical protein
VRTSRTMAINGRSQLTVTMRVPSGLKAALGTEIVLPLNSSTSKPDRASHTFRVWSSLPVTTRVPSWPLSSGTSEPDRASHTFAVWS